MADQFDLWRSERVTPTPAERRLDRPTEPQNMGGYWRVERAKTRHDTPIMIWTKEGETFTIFQRGAKVMSNVTFPDEWQGFLDKDWLKCVAVSKADWASAIETGRWPDGKPARQMSNDEKLGIATEQSGGNDAPVEETLADQIESLADKLLKVKEPTTQAEADALTGDLDRMRALLKKAGTVREEEYRPHKEAADAVSIKWADIMKPGQDAGTFAEALRKAYLKKVQAALDAEAAAERKRLADIADAERKEREKIAAEAAAKGEEPPPEPEPVPEPVVEAKRASAGTSFGRQSGLKKTKVGKIVNLAMLVNALLFTEGKDPDADLMAYLQERATKAVKGGFPLPGTVADEEYR